MNYNVKDEKLETKIDKIQQQKKKNDHRKKIAIVKTFIKFDKNMIKSLLKAIMIFKKISFTKK